MSYNYRQLDNGRWGIFIDGQLVATIGCFDTCQKILDFLESRLTQQSIPTLRNNHIVVTPYFHDMKLRP